MAWHDYDRELRSRDRGALSGWGTGYDRDWRRGTAWDAGMSSARFGGRGRGFRGSGDRYGEGYDYLGRRYGYDRDYQRYGSEYMRRRPEESPTYGRGGDQAVQRWARRYGYDLQYQVSPRGRRGRGGFSETGWGRDTSATGRRFRGGGFFGRGYQW